MDNEKGHLLHKPDPAPSQRLVQLQSLMTKLCHKSGQNITHCWDATFRLPLVIFYSTSSDSKLDGVVVLCYPICSLSTCTSDILVQYLFMLVHSVIQYKYWMLFGKKYTNRLISKINRLAHTVVMRSAHACISDSPASLI